MVVAPQADLSVDLMGATATIGDQAGTPAAGSFSLKTWTPTTGGAANIVSKLKCKIGVPIMLAAWTWITSRPTIPAV